MLYRDEVPYYIGQANVLYRRLHDHANKSTDRYFNFWNFFSAFVVSDKKYLRDVERILIAAMATVNSSVPRIKPVKMPKFVGARMREIRRLEVDPLARKDFPKDQEFLRHAGAISGPGDLSSRKGYSRG